MSRMNKAAAALGGPKAWRKSIGGAVLSIKDCQCPPHVPGTAHWMQLMFQVARSRESARRIRSSSGSRQGPLKGRHLPICFDYVRHHVFLTRIASHAVSKRSPLMRAHVNADRGTRLGGMSAPPHLGSWSHTSARRASAQSAAIPPPNGAELTLLKPQLLLRHGSAMSSVALGLQLFPHWLDFTNCYAAKARRIFSKARLTCIFTAISVVSRIWAISLYR